MVFLCVAHRACTACGYYKGVPVIQIKQKEKKKKVNSFDKVALDAMGGDHAPAQIIKGALKLLINLMFMSY